MKITVIGSGRWGSFIAWYLNHIKHDVTLYGRENSKSLQKVIDENPEFNISSNLKEVLNSEIIVISIASQSVRNLMQQIKDLGITNKKYVLCMKGLEISSKKRLTEVVSEYIDAKSKVAVWIGPGHVQEFKSGIPNCMVIDSDDEVLKEELVSKFSSALIRFYYGQDLIGNEIGAAAKNVIGIAAGMLDGLKLSTLKGALMSRGTLEIARLINELGGSANSAYGLCHLGDYEATVFSQYSHNRKFGECIVTNEPYDELAEGYYTVKALVEIGNEKNVELPICQAVYSVLYQGEKVSTAISSLFSRSLKDEW